MSTDFSIRPVGAPAPAPLVRPVSETTQQAVPTELPAAQTVSATDSVQVSRTDAFGVSDQLSHQAVFDRDAAEMVFQVVNSQTQSVVRQVPEEDQVRRRAYSRQLDRASEQSRPQHTDRTI